MAIFRPKPSQIFFFGLVPKSPIHIGLIYVKNPKPNISCLGPFKKDKVEWKIRGKHARESIVNDDRKAERRNRMKG